jgi:hypothetical protein
MLHVVTVLGTHTDGGGKLTSCQISGFRRDAYEICALLGYYAAPNANPLPTFRDNIGPIRCPETSVKDYHSALRNILEGRKSHYLLIIETSR